MGFALGDALAAMEQRVRRLVAEMHVGDPDPADPLRGLYLTPERIDQILDTAAARVGGEDRLADLATHARLSELDVTLLVVAAAPDVDPRFEKLFGYLNDDVTRKRASVSLALAVAGAAPVDATARARLAADAPLVAAGLVVLEDDDRPFLTRALRAPDRVVGYLLGSADRDPDVPYLDVGPWPAEPGAHASLTRALTPPSGRVLVVESAPGCARPAVRAAADVLGRPTLDLRLDVTGVDRSTLDAAAVDATLSGAVLVVGPMGAPGVDAAVVAGLVRHPCAVAYVAARAWDPSWPGNTPPTVVVDVPTPEERERILGTGVGVPSHHAGTAGDAADPVARLAGPLRVGPGSLRTVVSVAAAQARIEGMPVTGAHLRAGVRAVNGTALDSLTRRIEPAVAWADLVLPTETCAGLRQVCLRARYRDTVLGTWGMRPGGGRGRGVVALFTGDSGTGKTMSAEVVAADLGLDLYVVDLSTLVDKYVGETEKNLEKIFSAAAGMSAVLLFDEADAVFGKRSEVKDAHDRYANVESAYLLQRIETFDGIALLTTNLRANVDEAFTRRLDVIVDFPFPDANLREQLWDRCLGRLVPRSADVDLGVLAQRFDLAGGSIRACAVAAAYAAAAHDRAVAMTDLTDAVRQEYRKQGRLVGAAHFGPQP